MISSCFALFLIFILFASIAFFSIGICNDLNVVAFVGILLFAIEATGVTAVGVLMLSNDLQLWKTDELAAHITELTQVKEKTPVCYTINNNTLCGEFIYEDSTHRYEYKNNTLSINLK